jgi:polysaccharide export outer membrane protein
MEFSCRGLIASLALSLMASGCSAPAPKLVQSATMPVYYLNTADRVRVTVFKEPDASGDFVVNGDGAISYPPLGTLQVRGKPLEEIRQSIEARLKDAQLYNSPTVSLEVLNYRPFYILGEVNKPGEYPYSIGLTVPQAVAIAGGYSYRANKGQIRIKRGETAGEQTINVKTDSAWVMPGDTIRVVERHF